MPSRIMMQAMEKDFTPDYIQVPYPIYRDEDLEGADRLVYGVIYWFEHMSKGKCIASNDTIASVIGIKPRSVKNSLNRLEEKGYIGRSYKDGAHRHRIEINALVSFKGMYQRAKRMPLEGKVESSAEGILKAQIQKSKGKKKVAAVAAPVLPFNSEETKKKWYEGEDEAFQLLAWFFDKKGLWRRFDSRAKVVAATTRHVRSARRLIRGEWSQAECSKALAKMLEANPKMREEWTLDTLEKYLTK